MKTPILYLLMAFVPLHAQEADDNARLREALRNALLQVRTAQAETADARSAAIAAERKSKDLESRLADLEKRHAALVDDSNKRATVAEETIAKLNNRLADRDKRLADYTAAIGRWKQAYEALVARAAAAATVQEDLKNEVIDLKNLIADRERKNIALFRLSNEILDRYEAFSLGRSFAAREPFIGNARVRAENEVEGYRDRIIDHRLHAPAKPKPQSP